MKKLPILLFIFLAFGLNDLLAQPSAGELLANLIRQDSAFQAEEFSTEKTPFYSVSTADRERRANFYRSELAGMERIDAAQLSEQEKINYELIEFILADRIHDFESGFYQIPLNAEGGWFSNFVLAAENQLLSNVEDVEKYFEKLAAFPAHNDQHIELMREGLASGRTLPKVLLLNSVNMVVEQAVSKPEESIFYLILEKMSSEIPEVERKRLREKGHATVDKNVLPAYRKLLNFLVSEYKPAANDAIGISAQPGGMDYYEQRTRYFTTLEMTPEEVFEIGQSEVARIRKEMETIIEEVGFEGSFDEFLNFLRRDVQFYAKTPEEILMEASFLSKKIDGLLPKYFGTLPRNSYGVEPVPLTIASNYTSGRYSPGNLAEGRAGHYWVNTTKLHSRPLYALPALTLHEAVPGHHLQISLAQEMEGMPAFRRNTYLSAYGEGWALYCEWLGEEMGVYETPYERFGKLTYEMWRACRLVVDPGIHAKGWTRQQAIDFLASNTALSIHECTTEIDRYIGWPGQAVSYKIGELKIRELRKMAKQELEEAFDLRDFHDLILSNGSVPLFTLERMVNEWVKEQTVTE